MNLLPWRRSAPTPTSEPSTLPEIKDATSLEMVEKHFGVIHLNNHRFTRPSEDPAHWIAEARKQALVQAIVGGIVIHLANTEWVRFRIMDGDEEVEDHPLAQRLNVRANAYQTAADFRHVVAWRMLTAGEVFASVWGDPENPIALQPVMRGSRVEPIIPAPNQRVGAFGEPALIGGWRLYNEQGAPVGEYKTNQFLRCYEPDPEDPLRGMSPLEAAGLPADIVHKALQLQWSVLNNHGAAPFWVLLEGASPEVAREVEDYLRSEGRDRDLSGSGKVLGGDGKIKLVPGFSAQDVTELASWQHTFNLLLAKYHTSASALGLGSDETFSNRAEGNQWFVKTCIAYWAGRMANGAQLLLPPESELRVAVDMSRHPAMQENQDSLHQRIRDDYTAGLVGHSEAIEILGYDPDADDYKSTPAPFALPLPAANDDEEVVEAEVVEEGPTERELQLKALILKAEADSWERLLARLEATFAGEVQHYLLRQLKRLSGALKERWSDVAAIIASLEDGDVVPEEIESAVQLLFDSDQWDRELQEDSVKWYQVVAAAVALRAASTLRLAPAAGETLLADVVKERAGRITNINAATRAEVGRKLFEAVKQGQSLKEATDSLAPIFGESRARTVAQTEITSASSQMNFHLMGATGVKQHEWVSAGDDRVREGHDLDGEVRLLGEPFSNGLMYPGDPAGPPEMVINCRCVAVPLDV